MSLAGRLTAFFLGALALVLCGFSSSLYLVVRSDLYRQVDDRLEATLNMLSAVAEVLPDGVEWENGRLSHSPDNDSQVCWAVYDGQGRIVDRSHEKLGSAGLGENLIPVGAANDPAVHEANLDGQHWRLRQRTLQATHPSTVLPAAATSNAQSTGETQEFKYPAIVLRAGASLRPIEGTLGTLAITLPALSLGVWLLAALWGHKLCQRALAPVKDMADAARAMQVADLAERLPAPGTHDALDDLGRAFNELLSRLQEAFERERRFTGDASHQLRTPLAVMLGQVDVALRRDRTPEEYQQVLQTFSGQTVRLQRIVEMLLFLARADAEAVAPALTTISLEPWLQEHLAAWETHPRASDIRLVPIDDRPLLARAHGPLLGQVLDILLDNACKYSQPVTPITISCQDNGEHVELAVEDQGCGIEASDLPRVFDAFYRSPHSPQRDIAGVGLGLAIARRVTVAMGGTLDVSSRPGFGSRFVVRLHRSHQAPREHSHSNHHVPRDEAVPT